MLAQARDITVERLKALLTHPRMFELVRDTINFGVNSDPIKPYVDARPGERILDVGSGLGPYSGIVGGDCDYLGVDISEDYVAYATQRYGTARKKFEARDVVTYPFEEGSFDKAMMINVMHHLDEPSCHALLPVLKQAATERVVIVDPVPVPGRPIQRFWLSLDRGEYIRPLAEQERILRQHFDVRLVTTFETRSRSATHSVFVLG